MIKIEIIRISDRSIGSFKVTGHANYKKHGEDIVCSAVSVLTQTAVIGLVKVAKINAEYKIEEGNLRCKLPKIDSELEKAQCSAILDTMYEGLRNIKESYKEYIDIIEKEEV